MHTTFWLVLSILLYAYFIYPIMIRLCAYLWPYPVKKVHDQKKPSLCVLICAFNEETVIREKIKNTLDLDYPPEKKHILIISDGSTDRTRVICDEYSDELTHLWKAERDGKSKAQYRAMAYTDADIVLFSDANSFLPRDALLKLVTYFEDPQVGGVCGEKKIRLGVEKQKSGEGFYWMYESFVKKYDSLFYSVAGAPGEVFAIRRHLYEYPGDEALIEDFVLSLKIAMRGYRIAYAPEIYGEEDPLVWRDDFIRRRRIAAGGFQSMIWLRSLLNPFRYGRLSFIYISHRVLRWAVVPFLLPILFLFNALLVLNTLDPLYGFLLFGQTVFYGCAFLQWKNLSHHVICRLCFTVVLLNAAAWAGFYRFIRKQQPILWEKPRV